MPDDALEAWVRAGWRALLDADLPSLAAHPSPTNAPHLTLTTTDDEFAARGGRPGARCPAARRRARRPGGAHRPQARRGLAARAVRAARRACTTGWSR
nr:hypothetical protein [Angustibacter aerolatus]